MCSSDLQLIVTKEKGIFPFLIKDLLGCYQYYYNFMSRNNVDGVATRLRGGRSGIRKPAGDSDFFLTKNFPISSRAYPACHLIDIEDLSRT